MRVSVVINTLNRAASLRDTLDSLAHQLYDDMEVVVVNGPSTDATDALLAEYAGRVKLLRCPIANLSMSRNIGIRAATGDVVAFIDDDAIPERQWLAELVTAYRDPEVAGAGGVVFDHTGMDFQFRFGIADRYGDTVLHDERPDARALCVPGGWNYPSLLGTNSSFRRDVLAQVGLFDETYEYYLDETDLVVRIVDQGYVVTGVPGAPVHHHFLPSHVRNERRTVTHWYPVIKNRTYFALRHARDHRPLIDIMSDAMAAAQQRLDECAWAESIGAVPAGTRERAGDDVERGLVDGIRLAEERGGGPLPPVALEPPPFLPYRPRPARGGRRIALVTSGYPPRSMAGIARFMSEVAPELCRQGHDVRVITRADEHPAVEWDRGVWVHRIDARHRGLVPESFDHIDEFASSAVHELDRIEPWVPVDAVYGGAWDVETLGLVRQGRLPVTVMLATPGAVAADQAGWLDDPELAGGVRALLQLEDELFRTAPQVHGISHAIVDTVTDRYGGGGGLFAADRTVVFPLGMVDRRASPPPPRPAELGEAGRHRLDVVFVGRLERRKGIDVFLDAVERLCPDRSDLHVTIAGSDPLPADRSIARAWRAHVASAPWVDRVQFLGEIDDDLLHALYEHADVVVLPSRYESFGLVVVEAMMHSAAIVSSDVGGIAEVARAGVDALLVAPGDVDALEAAIAELLDDPTRRASLGAAARSRYESEFGIERAAAAVAAFVERSIEHEGTGRSV